MDLLEASSGDTTLEYAKVLLSVYVEGFFIYVRVWLDWGVCVVKDVLGGGVAVRGGGRTGRVVFVDVYFILGLGWVLKVEMMISGGEQRIDRIAH